jgi:2-oxoisovalerate dehydrogenase E2 component (dihydrolipoyl transacylase)
MAERMFQLPDLGEGLEEAEIGAWLVGEGDTVELNQPLVEVETAKAVVEIPSPFAGRVVRLHAGSGDTLAVGAPLVTFEVEADEGPPRPEPEEAAARSGGSEASAASRTSEAPPADAAAPSVGATAATPAVRKLAKDLGVDLGSVSGTGPGGRITRADVESAASSASTAETGEIEVVPISMVRRTIAESLAKVVREVPQVTTWRTLDCTALETMRAELDVSPLPIVVRALAQICVEHPWLNASYLRDLGEIHLHRRCHVSIATDTERGLLVPVVRDAGRRTIGDIAAEIRRLAAAAREGALHPEQMAGGTITVTNTGSYGSEAGTPLLNPPQGAILAIGVIQPRALVIDGRVEARPACTLSLTFDHRLLDGATAGRAFGDLVDLLGSSERLAALPR